MNNQRLGQAAATSTRREFAPAHGLVIVHTGDGKGKTTAAFGMLARMRSHGRHCVVVQFIKRRRDHATRLLHHPHLEWLCVGSGFTWAGGGPEAARTACETGWLMARLSLSDPSVDFVLLDELNIALACDYLKINDVLTALAARPAGQHVVITGRHALPELVTMADLVTEMHAVKHPFAAGVAAQSGIEF